MIGGIRVAKSGRSGTIFHIRMASVGFINVLASCLIAACCAQNVTFPPDTTSQSRTSMPITGTTCTLNADGSYSGPGTCEGFLERTQARYSNLTVTNKGCPLDQVLFYVDGDITQPKCGECKPGVSGLEDAQLACGINDFCDDDGRCRAAKSSPFYNQPCPYEQGGLTKYGWCGPGLRCIAHECLVCLEGVLDPTDGKRCVHGEWTYSAWEALEYNPNAVFQLCTLLLLALYLMFLLMRHTPAWKITVRWGTKAGSFVAKLWRKIKLPSVSLPTVRKPNSKATTTPSNISTDPLANASNAPASPAQSLELEEIENYLQANESIRKD